VDEVLHDLRIHIRYGTLFSRTGIVDELTDEDALFPDFLINFTGGILVGQVFGNDCDLDRIAVFQFELQIFQLFRIPGGQHEIEVMRRKFKRECFADPAGGTRDQDRLTRPVGVFRLLPCIQTAFHRIRTGRGCRSTT
jgi:hypothetical protein